MISNLTGRERILFRRGKEVFERVVSVQGDSLVPETEAGLGPYFNSDSCFSCHAHPSSGGTSPALNPQVRASAAFGAANRLPRILRAEGPALQVRRRFDPDGSRDGTVLPLFSIAGRKDADGCRARQFDLDSEFERNNLSFRIPTPLFGLGLIEAIPESAIKDNESRNKTEKGSFGILGRVNRPNRSGAITRFGWKAQVLSLEEFSAEAYLFEQGVTSELYPQKYLSPPGECIFNATPEDHNDTFSNTVPGALSNVSLVSMFIRFLAPVVPHDTDTNRGQQVFADIGCSLCHIPSMRTGKSSYAVLNEQQVDLYSDLLIHHMGGRLADDIVQGLAGPDEFRTAPLWGLGSRLFFLHDGRAVTIPQAIEDHFDLGESGYPASEANLVVRRYRELPPEDRHALILFLQSL